MRALAFFVFALLACWIVVQAGRLVGDSLDKVPGHGAVSVQGQEQREQLEEQYAGELAWK
jgi:hypothetical protein